MKPTAAEALFFTGEGSISISSSSTTSFFSLASSSCLSPGGAGGGISGLEEAEEDTPDEEEPLVLVAEEGEVGSELPGEEAAFPLELASALLAPPAAAPPSRARRLRRICGQRSVRVCPRRDLEWVDFGRLHPFFSGPEWPLWALPGLTSSGSILWASFGPGVSLADLVWTELDTKEHGSRHSSPVTSLL